MNKEEFLKSGLLEQYLLNLTDSEESQQVKEMLNRYPEIQQELNAMHKAIEQYAMSHSIPPPAHLKNKVRSKNEHTEIVDDQKTAPPPVARPLWRSLGRWAALLSLALLSLVLWLKTKEMNNDYTVLKREFQQQKAACEEQLQQTLNRPFAFVSDPSTQTVVLKGTILTPAAEAIMYWNPGKKAACLNILNLPEPPSDMQYQVWADVAGEMIDMGLIDKAKEHIQNVHFIAQAESFNITLEPRGGSEHPTVSLLQANGLVL